jgi:Caspase recruitment domain
MSLTEYIYILLDKKTRNPLNSVFLYFVSVLNYFVTGQRQVNQSLTLKCRLSKIIEPDYGLLEELISFQVLDDDEIAEIRAEKFVHTQNRKLLQLLDNKSEDHNKLFLEALNKTGQQHVTNWIKYNGCEFCLSFHNFYAVCSFTAVVLTNLFSCLCIVRELWG